MAVSQISWTPLWKFDLKKLLELLSVISGEIKKSVFLLAVEL